MSDSQDSPPQKARPAHLFKPGQSGNPGGQPKAYAEVRKLLDSGVLAAAQTMLDLAANADDPKVRIAAARDILDRTLGKAKESIEHSTDANGVLAAVIEAMRSRAP